MMTPEPGSSEDGFPVEEDLDELDEFDIAFAGSEFRSINAAMDQLQLALDRIESRNAGIHEELLELLQSNREIRMAFNQEAQGTEVQAVGADQQQDAGNSSETNLDGDTANNTEAEASENGKSQSSCDIFNEAALADLELDDKSKSEDVSP